MARQRVYVPITTAEYARLWGVSNRTARRRIAASSDAVKIGGKWRLPVTAVEYAKRSSVSPKVARRKGVRATSARDVSTSLATAARQALEARARKRIDRYARTQPSRRYNPKGVSARMQHASDAQLRAAERLKSRREWLNAIHNPSSDWQGSDGINILYYG